MRKFDRRLLAVAPMVAISVVFFLVPLLLLVLVSFQDGLALGTFQLDAYESLLGNAFNAKVLMDTVLLGLKVVGLTTLLGIPIGIWYLKSGPRVRTLLIFLTLFPMLTANIVRTFAWIVILGKEGLINATIVALGGSPQKLLFTEFGLTLALVQIELPLLVLPLIAVLSRVDLRAIEAAATLGAGPWRILLTVILPLSIPGILAGWILVFASSTTSFVTQAVIGGARLIYLPQFLYKEVGTLFNWPFAAAVAVVMLLTIGTVLFGLSLLGRHRRLVGHV